MIPGIVQKFSKPHLRRNSSFFDRPLLFFSTSYSVYLSMSSYKLDRTAFKAQTVEEASDHTAYYHKKSWKERLRISAHLNSVAFNYPENLPPRMDKTKFKPKSRNV